MVGQGDDLRGSESHSDRIQVLKNTYIKFGEYTSRSVQAFAKQIYVFILIFYL